MSWCVKLSTMSFPDRHEGRAPASFSGFLQLLHLLSSVHRLVFFNSARSCRWPVSCDVFIGFNAIWEMGAGGGGGKAVDINVLSNLILWGKETWQGLVGVRNLLPPGFGSLPFVLASSVPSSLCLLVFFSFCTHLSTPLEYTFFKDLEECKIYNSWVIEFRNSYHYLSN